MKRLLALLLLLAGCAAEPPPPAPPARLRAIDAPLASQVNVTANDVAGTWAVRRVLPDNAFAAGESLRFASAGSDLLLNWTGVDCGGTTDLCESFTGAASYEMAGPGRWRRTAVSPLSESPPQEIWVYWADQDRRTMAIGDADGTFAAIIDRNATGGADRIVAAREILDWFGYPVADLVAVGS